jgi:uncharacterized protein
MIKSCPSCKSYNARRSTVQTSEITLRNIFLTPYRCRDCRARFWVLSKHAYYAAGIFVAFVAVAVLAWHARGFIQMRSAEAPAATIPAPRLADLLKLAEANDPTAEYELARMYGNGFGVPKSLPDEQKWLRRAAGHGHIQAQYEYGITLRDGHGTVQDYEEARKWIQLAAEGGNGPAQLALGIMYRTGLGIPIDNIKAYVWLNVAAAQAVPGATAARDTVLPRLSPTELQEAQAQSRRLSANQTPNGSPRP